MEAWHEHYVQQHIEPGTPSSIVVWRDLLAFVASSWDGKSAPPIAALALPSSLITGSTYFRSPYVAPCVEPEVDLRTFRTMMSPAARRTCLVAAMDVMYEVSGDRIVGLKRQPSWGWHRVLPYLPLTQWTGSAVNHADGRLDGVRSRSAGGLGKSDLGEWLPQALPE